MNRDEKIKSEVNKTFESFEKQEKRKAQPFLHTRIISKLDDELSTPYFNWFFDIPFLKPAFTVLIIFINVFTVWQAASFTGTESINTANYITDENDEFTLNESNDTYYELYSE